MTSTLRSFAIPKNGNIITAIIINDLNSLASPEVVEECILACPNLKRISISIYNHQINNENLEFSLEKIIPAIAMHGKNIEDLQLQSPTLLDIDLSYIDQEFFPKLTSLSISYSRNIKARGIKFITSQCPKLTSLNLSYSLFKETDEAAFYIGKYLTNLKLLNMHRCVNLSDVGLIKIAEGCHKLEKIQIGRNYRLTDKALKEIGENCSELITLDLNYNTGITEKGLQYIIKGCPKFKNFYHSGWGGIRYIEEVKSKYPGINFSKSTL